MNNRFLNVVSIIACSAIFVTGCGDTSDLETPNLDTPANPGIVSQKNLSIGADDPQPKVYDPATGVFSETSLTITVKVGDLRNQLLTDSHTVYFATEWGLIEPSCVTVNGECSVTWQTSAFNNIPGDLLNTIVAYTLGEESFDDTNGNGVFDDDDFGSIFEDREEPFVDADYNGVFDSGDTLIDVVNGNDLTGVNGAHDIGDTYLNSPNCTHSSLCSTVLKKSYIWVDLQLYMSGPPTP